MPDASDVERRAWRDKLLYVALVPAICVAVLLLGAAALRTTLQIEKARQQTVFDATWSLAEERVDRLDKLIIAQDNVVAASVDVSRPWTIAGRWLPTAERETPTVRAVVVLAIGGPDHEVHAFVSRRPSVDDDLFRRLLVTRLVHEMALFTYPTEQLRHLHQVMDDQNYLLSYWQREVADSRFLVVAWHDVPGLVHEVMPQLYSEHDRNSRMNVIDQNGQILFGPPIQAGGFTVGLRFPTTLYGWRLQVALTSAEGLAEGAVRQRLVQLGVVALALLIAVAGTVIVVRASVQQRRLALAKSDFVANVSHELKTPLASVRMFSEMLLTGRVANDAKRQEYLQIIVGESERLSNLIDNVLDFAKVEKGKDAYEFHEDDLAEVVKRAVEMQRHRAERHDIDLVLELEPTMAVFDTRAIELAVVNMVDNAFKYAVESPTVTVAVRRDGDGAAIVRVADAGPGIEPDEQRLIFDRFMRGRGARRQHVRGSGIGLALVKHIAQSHGGDVQVISPVEDARGAAFELSLPARRS